MGYYRNRVTIAVAREYVFSGTYGIAPPDIEGFREELGERYRQLLVGPVRTPVNGMIMYLLLPDGSQEDFQDEALMDELRNKFALLFSDHYDDDSGPYDVITADILFGGDEPGAYLTHAEGDVEITTYRRARGGLGGQPQVTVRRAGEAGTTPGSAC